ncbi:MAG: hypothetical protein HGA77_10925 [Chlorobiaceae bacterium]|nr:hypothetical protein [Chlorobiaceae bacterium]
MRKIKNLLFVAALMTALSTPLMAASTSGTTNVTVTVPEFVILHYYSSIALNFATPDTEALDQGENSMDAAWDGTTSNGSSLASANLMTANIELDGTKTTVTLNNVWAVRGFSKSGNASVSITLPGDRMTLGSSEIEISNAKVTDGTNMSSTITTKLNGITKANATVGGVRMDLDFSKTTLSGAHTGGRYMITATTI